MAYRKTYSELFITKEETAALVFVLNECLRLGILDTLPDTEYAVRNIRSALCNLPVKPF